MNLPEVETAIPHRPPMLLVDEVVRQSEDSITCRKTFSADEFFFQGHYPGHPLVPGVILCESAMQAGAILLSRFVQDEAGGASRHADEGCPLQTNGSSRRHD